MSLYEDETGIKLIIIIIIIIIRYRVSILVVVVVVYLTTNQHHLGYLSSGNGTWQEDTAPLRFKRADPIGCSR